MATAKEPLSPSSPSLCASGLIGACLDGKVPVARGTVYQLARACAWILARAAGALATSGRPREALGAVLLLGFLLIFIFYQLYRLVLSITFGLSALTIFDAVIVWLTWREWRKQTANRATGLPE